jgi:NAD(P)-dependent dehydrogenase (short-subunit alcohol dehydrogenase family)
MDLGLAGRTCVVTGASTGIGLATARLLCAEGANVLLVALFQRELRYLIRPLNRPRGGENWTKRTMLLRSVRGK